MGKKTPKNSPKKQPAAAAANQSSPKVNKGTKTNTSSKAQETPIASTPTKEQPASQAEKIDSRIENKSFQISETNCNAIRECKDELLESLEATCYISEYDKALATFNLMETAISSIEWKTPQCLINLIMNMCSELDLKIPHETTPKNVIHRIRKLIIDEYLIAAKIQPSVYDATQFLVSVSDRNNINLEMPQLPPNTDAIEVAKKMREGVLGSLIEYKMELENIPSVYEGYGPKLIYHYDRILTYSYCPLLTHLFIEAAKSCKFTLFIVETAPMGHGHLLVDALRGCDIDIVLVPNSDFIFHLTNITKVIIPSSAVAFAGVRTPVFGGVIGLLSSRREKEVYVVAPSYHFSMGGTNQDNMSLSPYLLDSRLTSTKATYCFEKYDLIKKKDVTNIMTNSGCITPDQIERYLADLYAPKHEKEETGIM